MVTFQLAIRFEKFIFINFDKDATHLCSSENFHSNPFEILNDIAESTVKEVFDFKRSLKVIFDFKGSLKVIFEFQELFLFAAYLNEAVLSNQSLHI